MYCNWSSGLDKLKKKSRKARNLATIPTESQCQGSPSGTNEVSTLQFAQTEFALLLYTYPCSSVCFTCQ
ncbi:hypothetical protein QLX08_006509 [Tetragonisca angustula]|uniref:Uncharacterized protein n=1 Tax=Tetragonisca angustula TaxID=166442 RepID=A0AAW0ZVI8_9HYME